ncbi:MAG: hypothetical protein WBE91_01060 [Steroidobacteraceae bacterium]
MSLPLTDTLGWIATLVFVGSYFFSKPAALRACQMLGATLWIAYGILIAAKPVIAANLLVFGAAAWTLARKRESMPRTPDSAPTPI